MAAYMWSSFRCRNARAIMRPQRSYARGGCKASGFRFNCQTTRRHCEERLVRRSSKSEGGSDEAIQTVPANSLDCFAEPVIGPAQEGRTRWLAMTRTQLSVPAARFRVRVIRLTVAPSKTE